jgi:hypothetical protein
VFATYKLVALHQQQHDSTGLFAKMYGSTIGIMALTNEHNGSNCVMDW